MSKPDCIVVVRSTHGPAVTRGDIVRAVQDNLERALPGLRIPESYDAGVDDQGPYVMFPWYGSPSWVQGHLTDDFMVAEVFDEYPTHA